jgi:hypothetical protein
VIENKTELIDLSEARGSKQIAPRSLIEAIATAASNPNVDMDRAERMFRMHQEMVKAEAETAFNAALARAQSRMKTVAHNAANLQTNSKYAKLAAINQAITPIYTEEGFSVSFDNGDAPKPGDIRILGILSHSAGHSRNYHIDMPPDEAGAKGNVNKTRVHATGSTNSYARRYLILMMFNITTEDDTDGNQAKKTMPEKALADWLTAIEMAESMEQADALWAQILTASTEAGDINAHEQLRGAMLKRRKEIKTKGEAKA